MGRRELRHKRQASGKAELLGDCSARTAVGKPKIADFTLNYVIRSRRCVDLPLYLLRPLVAGSDWPLAADRGIHDLDFAFAAIICSPFELEPVQHTRP